MSSKQHDVLPYGSRAVALAHPEPLARAALLAGLEPAAVESCSVLELGCADAANLIAMAFHLEESRFVGVDICAAHIDRGREVADRLGLQNLELRHADMLELEDDLGTFDYIVVHDVLSRVDGDVRTRVFELISRHLSPQGVAYIDHDVAGGWALRAELTALLLRRVSNIEQVTGRIAAAREILGILVASQLATTSLHAAALAEEARVAFALGDAQLYYRYLTPTHHLLARSDVLALAEANELAPVAELSQRLTLEHSLRESLKERFEDGDDRRGWDPEELGDLMLGRSSRAAVLAHRAALRDDLDTGHPRRIARNALFRAAMRTEASRISFDADVAETFLTLEGTQVSVRNPHLKAALFEIGAHWPRALSYTQVVERASMSLELRRVLPSGGKLSETERDSLADDLLELHRLGHVEMRFYEPEHASEPGSTPRVSALTRIEASRAHVVTSPRHELVPLSAFAALLVHHLDGSREVDELAGRMRGHIDEGELKLHADEGRELSSEELDTAVPELVRACLEELAMRGLLT